MNYNGEMTPDIWKIIASIGTLLIGAVTAPIMWAIRAESKAIRMEFRAVLAEFKLGIKTDITEMEKRLNDRIDTRLIHK